MPCSANIYETLSDNFLPNTLHVLSTKLQLDVLLLTVHFGLQEDLSRPLTSELQIFVTFALGEKHANHT